MLALLRTYSWQELRHHPWRHAAAVLAVVLGVALAFSVHLINASALGEFSSAVRATSGKPDVELRAAQSGFDENLYARIAAHPQVELASPVLEVQTLAAAGSTRRPLRVLGVDALVAGTLAPDLVPVVASGADRLALFAPGAVFLNAAARQQFAGETLAVQVGLRWREARVAGTVAAGGGPLAVMDIGAAQDFLGRAGELSRIDVRLQPGTDRAAFVRELALPAGVAAAEPQDAARRIDQLSRAYRVNLTVLALVALFTGAFLVYSVLALGVARRAQQFALLGVLGLTARQRRRLVLGESAVLGAVGSALGIALGTALAELALALLGGDLGGGYFPGVSPHLQWSAPAALLYGALGVLAALVGGWVPARAAERFPLAQTLKGLGAGAAPSRHRWRAVALLPLGAALAFLPPIAGLPLAAYLSVGLLLVGGIAALPWAVSLLYDRLAPWFARRPLPLLAIERARRVRETAAVAVSGVVAALSLAVALTVMVASFRESVARWLDVVLPAPLYVRASTAPGTGDAAFFGPDFAPAVARVEGVRRVAAQRLRTVLLDPARPPVAVVARPVGDASRTLPLVGELSSVPSGTVPVYVSEAMVDLYGARPGQELPAFTRALGVPARFAVAGVWRDYVRQNGTVLVDAADYQRLTGDRRANELQLWLDEGAAPDAVQARIREAARTQGLEPALLEFASAEQLRAVSLRIFDRSFAVTYWLQAVAIGIGLFGVAASFSAQVLARRKEFGLLSHLGLTRRQVLAVVAGEGLAWTSIGALAGLVLGLAVAAVLVYVVNPQSFHWTMDLDVPWPRLAALCAAVVAAGTFTAWAAGRAAAGRDAVLAVKEDW